MEKAKTYTYNETIIRILVGVAIFGLIAAIYGAVMLIDNHKWNNGYCDCGGHWEYVQSTYHDSWTGYVYKCDTCGKSHEFKYVR